MSRLIAIGSAVGALLLASCGGDDGDDSGGTGGAATSAPAAAETGSATPATGETGSAAPAAKGTTIKVSSSDYGRILFGGNDQAIYLFDKESGSKSECYGDCAAAWPPVLTKGEPQAVSGTEANLLGTTKRNDGTTQVTYNGQPLYYYAHEGPNQVLCQNVSEFGGLWLVVEPGGEAIR
jgi:predicted lipoprotein with Yx(FWY)xxD motif